jgi:hypothetical protein
VITPPSLGVGMLEFHQLDRMVEAGRMAARALLDATGGDLHSPSDLLVAPEPRMVRYGLTAGREQVPDVNTV